MSALLGLGKPVPAVSPDRALLVTGNIVEEVSVLGLTAECVTTPAGEYPREHVTELVRPKGGRVFLVNASLPARLEAEQVRSLRRNALLHGLFHDRSNPDMNRVPMPVWLVMGGLILGLVIVGAAS